MKKILVILIFLPFAGFSQILPLNPQPKKIADKFFPDFDVEINTPAFNSDNYKRGFTNYEEMMTFLYELEKSNKALMNVSFIGESQKGKKIPLVTINNSKINSNEKIKFWIQGGLHGDEPASTEGVLLIIQKLLTDSKYSKYINRFHFEIVPMANIDGYERNYRNAINGLDLNRDQTKMRIPETKYLKRAFTEFGAEIAIDFHEYRPIRRDFAKFSSFGIASAYDVLFHYSGNLNVPIENRLITKNLFVSNASKELNSLRLENREYMTTRKYKGDIHFRQGTTTAISSTSSFALTNCISTLVEIRGVGIKKTSFKRRVMSTFYVGMSFIKTAHENFEKVKSVAKNISNYNDDIVVKAKPKIKNMTIKAIDIAENKKIDLEILMQDLHDLDVEITRKRPIGYLVPKNLVEVIERLDLLGVEMSEVENQREVVVEKYLVTDYFKEPVKYEGIYKQEILTELVREEITLSEDYLIIKLNQKHSNLAVEVLEPETSSSFVLFNVVNTEHFQTLPYLRIIEYK